jgi:hypothetical protein
LYSNDFLDVLRLEKTVCFESADWNSNIRVHRPFFCQLKFFSYWFIPHCEKSRKMPLNAKETNPFKINQQIRRWNQIFKSKADRSNKKFSKLRTSGNSITVTFSNVSLDSKLRHEYSSDIVRSKFSI